MSYIEFSDQKILLAEFLNDPIDVASLNVYIEPSDVFKCGDLFAVIRNLSNLQSIHVTMDFDQSDSTVCVDFWDKLFFNMISLQHMTLSYNKILTTETGTIVSHYVVHHDRKMDTKQPLVRSPSRYPQSPPPIPRQSTLKSPLVRSPSRFPRSPPPMRSTLQLASSSSKPQLSPKSSKSPSRLNLFSSSKVSSPKYPPGIGYERPPPTPSLDQPVPSIPRRKFYGVCPMKINNQDLIDIFSAEYSGRTEYINLSTKGRYQEDIYRGQKAEPVQINNYYIRHKMTPEIAKSILDLLNENSNIYADFIFAEPRKMTSIDRPKSSRQNLCQYRLIDKDGDIYREDVILAIDK